jgi:hypothetical protein
MNKTVGKALIIVVEAGLHVLVDQIKRWCRRNRQYDGTHRVIPINRHDDQTRRGAHTIPIRRRVM